ncbi:unnamed protein product [Triticum turgidum subsp. durum]|uniref:Peptidase C14 caspase domain-containing protein n=1 Tax=Triticum turgidum subsp. durum TaxID=4567 RepID=A0A9R0X4R2_TRITD|nr:unnamed protein product [Triticum turgidum subsp. durum]
MEGETTKRLATLVGCNYVGTRYELRGCINDVDAVRDTLVARFGFAPADVAVLTDGRGAEVLPTGANIRRALADMVARAAPGDVLFFHYSGGLIDQEKEQIGPSVGSDPSAGSTAPARTARFLPYGAILDHLSAVSGMPSSHHVADHLVALFGADASAKLHVHGGSGNGSTPSTTPAPAPTPPRPDEGILLSGCQTNETSADVPAYEASGGKACGAFSSAVQSVLAAHPAPLSNRELVAKARAVLEEQGFEQHPCLYCTDANAEARFLSQDKKEETAVGAASPAMSAALL